MLVVKVGSFPESIAFIKETVFIILCAPNSTHRMFFILFGQLSADLDYITTWVKYIFVFMFEKITFFSYFAAR